MGFGARIGEAVRLQPGIQLCEAFEAQSRREQPVTEGADLALDLTLLPACPRRARYRLHEGECLIFCVSVIWSMLSERSKDYDNFPRTAGRAFEGLRAA